MKTTKQCSREDRERAVRMVPESQDRHPFVKRGLRGGKHSARAEQEGPHDQGRVVQRVYLRIGESSVRWIAGMPMAYAA